jgi:hypothetical protein
MNQPAGTHSMIIGYMQRMSSKPSTSRNRVRDIFGLILPVRDLLFVITIHIRMSECDFTSPHIVNYTSIEITMALNPFLT